ncbi:hypothetical protein TGPRC2_245995 [Toxoplasma gondii TgCatPRC2]|uniref:Uncharacterized protein n=5 Tax=Toxoplasma gondii TaxID=5811 RepID=A0A151HGA4_TOXGO|nr:hypothetical protein TGARI_245995 [Toxoplasma gondii ARI]KYK68402.1 hypothetical protein TGPRC2_245995 [Toxoplasma gondii TgCatPRC2]PIM04793.1 hypothetical protein TGCOUG_245995 [Toxoplasma gondii COUG]
MAELLRIPKPPQGVSAGGVDDLFDLKGQPERQTRAGESSQTRNATTPIAPCAERGKPLAMPLRLRCMYTWRRTWPRESSLSRRLC